jgi:hypothetical protein
MDSAQTVFSRSITVYKTDQTEYETEHFFDLSEAEQNDVSRGELAAFDFIRPSITCSRKNRDK